MAAAAEVDQFDVAISVIGEHDVLRLQVAVNNLFCPHEHEALRHLEYNPPQHFGVHHRPFVFVILDIAVEARVQALKHDEHVLAKVEAVHAFNNTVLTLGHVQILLVFLRARQLFDQSQLHLRIIDVELPIFADLDGD